MTEQWLCPARARRKPSDFRRPARSGQPASAVGSLPAHSRRSRPQAKDAPLIWRWRDIEPFAERAVGEVSIDDVERRALILVNPAFAGETVTTSNLIAAFTVLDPGRPRAPAPPHLRGDPFRHPRRRRRHHRQRPALRDARRRSHPDAADVLARPHQRKRSPHHLVRCRQHAADPRPRRQFLRARRSAQQRSSGRSTRATSSCGPRPASSAPTCRATPRIRRNIAIPAPRPAGCWPRCPPGPDGARTVRYTNPVTGGAVMPTLDCYAVRLRTARHRHGRSARPDNMICLVVSGAGPLAHRRAQLRLVAARRVHASRTGPGRATRRSTATPICSSSPTSPPSSGSICCARNCNRRPGQG